MIFSAHTFTMLQPSESHSVHKTEPPRTEVVNTPTLKERLTATLGLIASIRGTVDQNTKHRFSLYTTLVSDWFELQREIRLQEFRTLRGQPWAHRFDTADYRDPLFATSPTGPGREDEELLIVSGEPSESINEGDIPESMGPLLKNSSGIWTIIHGWAGRISRFSIESPIEMAGCLQYYTYDDKRGLGFLTHENQLFSNAGMVSLTRDLLKVLGGLDRNFNWESGIPDEMERLLPFALGPTTIARENYTWIKKLQFSGFDVAFGSLEATRKLLERENTLVQQGKYSRCSVEVEGPLAPEFVQWIFPKSFGTEEIPVDPIPHIEIIHVVPLPSGEKYRYILKAGLKKSVIENPDISKSGADQKIVDCLSKYLLLDQDRKTLSIFHGPAPTTRKNLTDLIIAMAEWKKGVFDKLLALESNVAHQRAPISIFDEALKDREFFNATLHERLDALPYNQPYLPADYVRLNPEEREQFSTNNFTELYELCMSEQARVKRELEDGTVEKRKALGHEGPITGTPLSLDFMLMDMIIHFRRTQKYVQNMCKQKGCRPEEVIIPEYIGRSYRRMSGILDAAGIRNILDERAQKRKTIARIFDPSTNATNVIEGREAILRFEKEMHKTNIGKLRAAVRTEMATLGRKDISVRWHDFSLKVSRTLEKIDLNSDELQRLRDERTLKMRTLQTTLATTKDHKQRAAAFQKLRDRLDPPILALEKKIFSQEESYMTQVQEALPYLARSCLLRVTSIEDRHAVKLSFSVVPKDPNDSKSKGEFPDEVRYGLEEADDPEAPTRLVHSQLSHGVSNLSAGRVQIERFNKVFHDFDEWKKFDANVQDGKYKRWKCARKDNGSGHYQPLIITLPYASVLIDNDLRSIGVDVSGCALEDVFVPGLSLRQVGLRPFQKSA